MTFVRDRKPVKLLRELQGKKRTVECVSNGIYYIDEPWFAVQLIVTSELDEEEHCWLRALTQRLSEAEVQRLICRIQNLEQQTEWKYADSVLEVAVTANKKVFEIVKEEMGMCNALRELMAPEIEQELEAATERGRTRGLSRGIAQGISQGIAQGISQGVEQEIYSCLSEGLYGTAIGARKLNITENELIQRMTKAGYTLPQ